ncbi:MAG: hypothetical protein K2K57_14815 [Oscillospiraceae bacterium]|nr:hypothetical protein [Oscillospiraceae bacterium]
MSDILQITTPVAPRDYGNNNQGGGRQQTVQQSPDGQVFDLGNQMEVVKTNDRGGENANRDLKNGDGGGLIRAGEGIAKNPAAALDTAKALISRETLSLIRENGDTEALGKLTEFASEVMLSPETLAGDMAAQQKNATIFGDKLWSVLKDIMNASGSDVFKEAVADFAKAAADLSSKEEILRSLSANFKFLSLESAPNKAVADELMAASRALSGSDAATNFPALKPVLLQLLGYTEKSLLINDDIKKMLPLIVHTMSRYTDSPDALRDSFEAVLKLADGLELTNEQLNSLLAEASSASDKASGDFSAAENSENFRNANTAAQGKETLDSEKPFPENLQDNIKGYYSRGETREGGAVYSSEPEGALVLKLRKMFDSYVSKNEYLTPKEKQAALLNPDTAVKEAKLTSAVNLLAAGAKHMAARIPSDLMGKIISTVNFSDGAPAAEKILGAVLPNTTAMRDAMRQIFDSLEETRDLDAFVMRLNTILENIGDDESDNMIKLAQGLNSALGEMAASGNYDCSAATSMETLADFLTKNINNSFLQSLSGMNQGEMVQNMLTAPGLFTPLLHHFVPLDAFGMRAFGELWIDPHADEADGKVKRGKGDTSAVRGTHMFLCFDVEDEGYFELELFEKNKNISVMLLCPENKAADYASIRSAIPKIAASVGYRAESTIVDTLHKRRTVDNVFPKLADRRTGLNLRV